MLRGPQGRSRHGDKKKNRATAEIGTRTIQLKASHFTDRGTSIGYNTPECPHRNLYNEIKVSIWVFDYVVPLGFDAV
jgi:hypothetical protein